MKQRTIKDWIIAVRPWSFPASVIPVLVTLGYLYYIQPTTGYFNWLSGWLAFPMLVLLHGGGNLVSDYFDHVKGVDLPGSLNGVNHIHSGKFQPKTILHYGWMLLAVGALIGIVILLFTWKNYHSYEAVWIGVAAIALPLLYPWMKGHALGDVDILLCFAMLPSVGICYIMTGDYHWEMLLYCLSFGLLTVSILHSNNTRDIENDCRAGLRTLCGIIGRRTSQYIYLVELATPYVLVCIFVACEVWPLWTLLIGLTLPLAVRNARIMLSGEQHPAFPALDKFSAQLQMAFGLLTALGFALGVWLC